MARRERPEPADWEEFYNEDPVAKTEAAERRYEQHLERATLSICIDMNCPDYQSEHEHGSSGCRWTSSGKLKDEVDD